MRRYGMFTVRRKLTKCLRLGRLSRLLPPGLTEQRGVRIKAKAGVRI